MISHHVTVSLEQMFVTGHVQKTKTLVSCVVTISPYQYVDQLYCSFCCYFTLYLQSMKKCLDSGQKEGDDSIIELSVKLATVYATQSRDDEAELGFKYCMDTMNEKVKKCGGILEADTNTLALQGLSIQSRW